jgi:hypothetical protein
VAVKHRRPAFIALLVVAIVATRAIASGGPPPTPYYVLAAPQGDIERNALARGNIGIIKVNTTDALLYLDWRALNGLPIGRVATDALASPCCGDRGDGTGDWLQARRQVPGARQDVYYVSTEREGPNYTTIPNCFNDAFVTAVATLKDRVARFGKQSASVRAWLDGQDAVFEACGKPGVSLPPLAVSAPAWLRADRAYQQAAYALYDGHRLEAATRFAAIARDATSPWQPTGLYLEARAIQREALVAPSSANFARAHAAIDHLAAARAGTYGQGEVIRMRQVLEYHEHPAQLLARLDRELGNKAPATDIAVAFRDYMSLSDATANRPEAADWIRTIQLRHREEGLAHARARWVATGKVAWLAAALTFADPSDPAAASLIRAANALKQDDPAHLTANYHAIRLTMKASSPAATREKVDRLLAMPDLSRSDYNIVAAMRAQLATSLAEFARLGLRKPYCSPQSVTCVDAIWPAGDGLVGRTASGGFVGIGAESRAIIDRLPLAQRITLAADSAIPRELRLDLALTSYARAVQLQDQKSINRLATMLAVLLPQLAADWHRIALTPPGADKRFAESFVMAKIPSIRVDLASYERPVGTVSQFGGYWVDWMVVKPGAVVPPGHFAPASAYRSGGYWDGSSPGDEAQEQADLTCLDRCGLGKAPLRMPGFAMALLARARAERGYFLLGSSVPRTVKATSLWEETLAYAYSHPRDPRAPETLYRLIRVARWGGNHNHLGRRAFGVLHRRYQGSSWARRSPYYYD